jgi:putative DNA methylase
MRLDNGFPLAKLNGLARLESYNKHYYRPANYLHKWWARRLGSVFRTILLATFLDEDQDVWQAYYQGADFRGKIVLDPFMGGGTTVMEALRLRCKVVGVDLNPVAWWIVKKAVEPVNLAALDAAFGKLEAQVAERIKRFYKTVCPHCKLQADALYIFWVKVAPCLGCGHRIRLHASHVITRYRDRAVVHCPACGHVFETKDIRKSTCPFCGRAFDARHGVVKKASYICPACGHRNTTLDAARQTGEPLGQEIFAVSYLCPTHGQGFKAADESDLALYSEAEREFLTRRESLRFPHQAIPPGLKTDDLLNHNYRYWYQLFNPRQLLCLDMLLGAILALEDENVQECMLTLFSSVLEFNNMFCSYKGVSPVKPGAVRHIFSHHAFVVPREPLENNLWGVGSTSGTFSSLYRTRLRRAKEYCLAPVERVVRRGKTICKVHIPGEKIEGRLVNSFAELQNSEGNALLLCGNSEHLDLPDASVDAVITDPPYFDNVQYSELADFFYVWLRLGLQNRYPAFRPELTPKEEEVVKNLRREKDSASYLEGLTAVFRECHRVLKDDGVLAFTFHHKEPEAWAILLQAVLDAGFTINATYPVHAEMPISVHIHNQEAMEYDAILFCRKRMEEKTVAWDELESMIRTQAAEVLAQVGQQNGMLSRMDTTVIVLGKCLEFYSQYYPYVTQDGRRIGILEALKRMTGLVDTLAMAQPVTGVSQAEFTQLRLLEERAPYKENEH